jgi:amino acid transporter
MSGTTTSAAPLNKGLRTDALGFVEGVVIGVASTAPAYSLAASLGFVVIAVGAQAPAIMLLACFPMAAIAGADYYMNRADPDCGTAFSWATRALGPWVGWIAGWALLISGIVVIANLAEIASLYTYYLLGIEAPDQAAVLALGVAWIAALTTICYIGIKLAARTQLVLLTVEVITLSAFTIVALTRVYTDPPAGAMIPSLDWLNPFLLTDWGAFGTAMVLALFIYWGWDSAVSVNEETRDATETPGRAAVVSTVLLLIIYVGAAIAVQAFAGVEFLSDEANADDVLAALGTQVLGSPWDKILIFSVLTSAAASTQTTILPNARSLLSMATKQAVPTWFGRVHPRFRTPGNATIALGVVQISWYVGLTLVSQNLLYDAIAALGLLIALYYGATGYACVVYYRHELRKSVKNLVMMGLVPLGGALVLSWAFVQSILDLSNPENAESGELLGLGAPVTITLLLLLLGAVLMVGWRVVRPAFFRRHAEVYGSPSQDDLPPVTA